MIRSNAIADSTTSRTSLPITSLLTWENAQRRKTDFCGSSAGEHRRTPKIKGEAPGREQGAPKSKRGAKTMQRRANEKVSRPKGKISTILFSSGNLLRIWLKFGAFRFFDFGRF